MNGVNNNQIYENAIYLRGTGNNKGRWTIRTLTFLNKI